MLCKYPAVIVVIVLSCFCVHLVSTFPGSPWLEMGAREEDDQFLFADCAVSNLTEVANETMFRFDFGIVNRTQFRIDADPGWHEVSWSFSNRMVITVMNRNTTQLAVRINVFGYPNPIDNNETDVESLSNGLWSTERVIYSDDYEGGGGVTVLA